MDQQTIGWLYGFLLCLAFARPMAAGDAAQTDSVEPSSTVESQILIRLDPLDLTAKYPPVVTALGGSSDGKWLIAAGDDHALRIVQLNDGKMLETLKGHTDWVQAVSFIGDRSLIVSCSKDCTLRTWSASEHWSSKVLHHGDVALMAMAIDAKNQYVACAGFGPEIWIYSLNDGNHVKTITSPCNDQRALAFSSDGRQIASGGRDGVVRVWDWPTDLPPLEQALHHDRIRSIQFSDNDTIVTTIGEDRRFVRYQLGTGQVLLNQMIAGGRLLSMTNIDSNSIAVAGSDNTIRLIDISTGTEINRLFGHDGSVAIMIRSGNQLVSGSFDTTIRTWDLSKAMKMNSGNYEHPVSARFQDSGAGEAVR